MERIEELKNIWNGEKWKNKIATEEWFLEIFGKKIGKKYYQKFLEKNESKGTINFFIKKHGLKDGILIYAIKNINTTIDNTLNGFIKRHGEDIGKQKYEEYKKNLKNSLKGINSLDFYNKKYGEINGPTLYKEKGKKISDPGRGSLIYFIKKYGEVEGKEKYNSQTNKKKLSSQCSLSYWLKVTNGNGEEARKLLKERQSTFSLEKCIKKYGEVEGKRIWQERQDKWQNTLNSKESEEIKRINKSKGITLDNLIKKYGEVEGKEKYYLYHTNKGASKESLDTFFPLIDWILENTNICYNEIFLGSKDSKEFHLNHNKNRYYYDFCIKKLKILIEFNGIGFHIKKNDINNKNIKLAYDIDKNKSFYYNRNKIKFATLRGFKVLQIWSNDKNKFEKCIKFLKYHLKKRKK